MQKPTRDIKTALCIKNGFMSSGNKFCRENVLYEYYLTAQFECPYNVKSERQDFHNHSMSEEFFSEYFITSWEWPENENDLFEI